VTRMQNATKAWRPGRVALLSCLRTVRIDAFYHELGSEQSLRSGGPPG
jgi:hypothetical protein